jgi:hypothetical protein
MNWNPLDLHFALQAFLSTQTAPLPQALPMQIYLRLAWACVLAVLALGLMLRVAPRLFGPMAQPAAITLCALVFVLTLMPGSFSPAYWLGLAFAAPSLMSAALSVWGLRALLQTAGQQSGSDEPVRLIKPEAGRLSGTLGNPLQVPLWAGVILGLLLLLDTFAVFPGSLYALGFSQAALAAACLLLAIYYVAYGLLPETRKISFLLFSVLAVYALLRLPSGSLWDALIDPWLWLGLVLIALRRAWQQLSLRGSNKS